MAPGMNKLAGLLVGGRNTASLGRVAFWLVFGLCVYFWLGQPVEAFPDSLDGALYTVLGYNLGGKAVNNFSRRGRRWPGTGEKSGEDYGAQD